MKKALCILFVILSSALFGNNYPTPLLTNEELKAGYYEGQEKGASHMLIVWDTFDYNDSYNYIVYRYDDEKLEEVIHKYTAPGYSRVTKVYSIEPLSSPRK